jgi:hypothetical protein
VFINHGLNGSWSNKETKKLKTKTVLGLCFSGKLILKYNIDLDSIVFLGLTEKRKRNISITPKIELRTRPSREATETKSVRKQRPDRRRSLIKLQSFGFGIRRI